MSSITAPVSLYTLCNASVVQQKKYNQNSVMSFIHQNSPLFAFCIQKLQLDDWFDSPDFNSTCFVPIREYSDKYFEYFTQNLDYETARNVVSMALITGRITRQLLSTKEYIPTHNKYNDLNVIQNGPEILLNNCVKIVKSDIELANGIVHIVNGLLPPLQTV